METGHDEKRRIDQLVKATNATEQALKIVSDISINPLLSTGDVQIVWIKHLHCTVEYDDQLTH